MGDHSIKTGAKGLETGARNGWVNDGVGDLRSGITIFGRGIPALRLEPMALEPVPEVPEVSMIPEAPRVPPALGITAVSGIPEAPVLPRGRMESILTIRAGWIKDSTTNSLHFFFTELYKEWKDHFVWSKHNKKGKSSIKYTT